LMVLRPRSRQRESAVDGQCSRALLRVLLRLQGLGRGVQTEVHVTELLEPYVRQIMAMRFDPRRIARQVGRAVRSWDHFISGLPDDLRVILEQIRTGSVGIDFRVHDADHAVDRLVDGLVTAAAMLAGARLISRRTALRTPRRFIGRGATGARARVTPGSLCAATKAPSKAARANRASCSVDAPWGSSWNATAI
jgi:hypothetical protein